MPKNELNELIDLDLSVLRKQRFRINGDDNKILELNVSDFSLISRLSDSYPKLDELYAKLETIGDETSDDELGIKTMGNKLKEVDLEMRELVDFIFDAKVCDVCADSGSMYDLINGVPRYEHIITILVGLYEKNINSEIKKVKTKIKTHTQKYTSK
jgi:hypothetical protein